MLQSILIKNIALIEFESYDHNMETLLLRYFYLLNESK